MIHTRNLTTSLHLRDDGDGRTLVGPLLPWGVEAQVVDRGRLVVEVFQRGGRWTAPTRPACPSQPHTHETPAPCPSG